MAFVLKLEQKSVEGRGFQLGRRRNGWAGVKWRVRENDEGGGEDDTNGERV